jgi:hypothetical protein
MEFRLLYQGILTANGSVTDKFLIRRQIHPQLRRLCLEHHELHSQFIAYGHIEARNIYGDSFTEEQSFEQGIKRVADTELNGFRFMCQGRSKTRPVGRSKSRPVDSCVAVGLRGRRASGA